LQTKLAELNQKRDELLIRYMEKHPQVQAVDKQIGVIRSQLANVRASGRSFPAMEREMQELVRERQFNHDLYAGLLGAGSKLRMVEPGSVANVRLVDRAEPPIEPVTMSPVAMIGVASLGGILLGLMAAFVRGAFLKSIHGAREIEQSLGVAVCAVIPHSETQEKMYRKIRSNANEILVLPPAVPCDGALESLRVFRSTLQFLMRDTERNIIMMTGPTPEVGKSFVSANFAAVLAAVGKRVLLIDADMRTGYLHRYFGVARKGGLSDALMLQAGVESVIRRGVAENVDFISTGTLPQRPSELLAHANFGKLLQFVAARYDYVLIDTAPVLGFSDALIVGEHAAAIFSVVRDGVSSIDEAEEAVKCLNRAGLTVTGVVLNDLKASAGRYGYGYESRYRTVGAPRLSF
jgi:tyrosine-protein kinase Etk/Wzc